MNVDAIADGVEVIPAEPCQWLFVLLPGQLPKMLPARRSVEQPVPSEVSPVCRNVKTLYNYEPPATEQEIRAAALQYVRKITGSTNPSAANREAFERAVDAVAEASAVLLRELVTTAPPRDREVDAARARERAARRFGARSAGPRPDVR